MNPVWSFAASVAIFVVLGLGLGLWQWRTRHSTRRVAVEVDQHIHAAAEIAQRRHQQKFGRASTDIAQAMNGTRPA
jgi:uncharacterized protein HemX